MNKGISRHRQRGVTLIELMIACVVLAILALIAVPSYQDSVRKSRRADGKVALTSMAQRLERCMTQFGAYNDAACQITSPYNSDAGYYRITVTRGASTFSLSAAAQGAQARDSSCATLGLDNLGARSGGTACW